MPGLNIPPAIITATTTFLALFDSTIRRSKTVVSDLAERRSASGNKTTYEYMPLGVQIEEITGSIDFAEDRIYEYSVKSKKYGKGLAVPLDAYEDAQNGGLAIYEDRTRQLAAAAVRHPQRLLAQAMNAGFTATGPDGQAFFSTAHASSEDIPANASRANRLTGDPALSAANFELALTLLDKMCAYNGDELAVREMGELVLTVPPTLRSMAETIVEQQFLSTGESNKNYKRAKLRVMPELENLSTTAWYLSVEGPNVPKPFVYQERKAPTMSAQTSMDSDTVFKEGKFLYKTEARYAFGYNHCEVIVASDGTAD